ncbi:MAG: substrate-binding domain-containing protein, partial [Candidatus Aquilonibacter sp.]
MGFLARFSSLAVVVGLCAPLAPALADTSIRVGGSTNITPPLSKMAPAYQAAHPGTTITIAGSSSGQGIAALKTGALDVACSDVPVDDPAFEDTSVGVIGIAFVVGSGAGVKNLTREDVQGIYSGKYT